MKPKVSVFIPAWNAEHFIAATISSILDQDYQNIELIVINNGSTDGTQSVLEKIKLKDPRLIIVYLKEGVSPFKARQIGFELSTGVFCMNMDHDDCLAPKFFSEIIPFMEKNKLDMASCHVQITDENLHPIVEKNLREPSVSFITKTKNDYSFFLSQRYTGWDKLVRRSYLIKHNYHYDVEKELGLFVFTFYDDCKNGFCPQSTYLYRTRQNSISHNFMNSIRLNANPENSSSPIYPLKENIKNQDIRDMVSCFLIKSLLPIIMFRSLGDASFNWQTDFSSLKRAYNYSTRKMRACYPYFSLRTKKIALIIMFHVEWMLRLYIKLKVEKERGRK